MTRLPAFARPALATALAALLAAGAAPTAWAQATPAAAASAPAPSLRPEVAKPLQAAQDALKANNAKDALARIAEAEAVPALTSYEGYILRRLKAPALFTSGDIAGALALFEGLLSAPELPKADKPLMQATVAKLAVQLKDYAKAVAMTRAHLAEGGSDADLKRMLPSLLAAAGDDAGVVRELAPVVAADEAAGRATPEATLRVLAASQDKLGDKPGYNKTVERLAATTNKADYWAMAIAAVTGRAGFADDRLRLDVYRLRRAAGLSQSADEVGDMAYRANQAGLPAEAQALLDEGFASNLLSAGKNAAEDRKLRDAAAKAAAQDRSGLAESEASAAKAKDGNPLFNLGLAVSAAGGHDKALALMAAGQAKGGLRRPDEALLHLGLAQWRAGKLDDAVKTWAGVQGSDGTADLARLWTLVAKAAPRK